MSQLILIRHSLPERDTTIPAAQWRLSHQGRERCGALAEQLKPYNLTLMISSVEPKAVETARLAGGHLGIASQIAAGLHEHDRSNVGFLPERGRFEALVREFFDKPGEKVFGTESANDVYKRIFAALQNLIEKYPAETLGVISHGTVITILLSMANDISPFDFWKNMSFPSIMQIGWPNCEILKVRSVL
jgi:broad specificity phosphatase PhoE